jgi:hypothetical protein
MRTALFAAALGQLALVGCGDGSGQGRAKIDGTLGGDELKPGAAIVLPATDDPEGIFAGKFLSILITESANPCDALMQKQRPPGSFVMGLLLHDEGGGSLRAGDYAVVADRFHPEEQTATAALWRLDASCKSTSAEARAGMVTLDHAVAVGAGVSGSFTLALPSGTVTGTFSAAACNARPVFDPPARCGP